MHNLNIVGIKLRIRKVIPSQFNRLLRTFDYDIIVNFFPNDGWPISEVDLYWNSKFAAKYNSLNLSGLEDPFVDKLLAHIRNTHDITGYKAALKALDRYLLNNAIVIPQWHTSSQRILSQKHVNFPNVMPNDGLDIHSLWIGEKQSAKFKANC